jgi:hypothetical protein
MNKLLLSLIALVAMGRHATGEPENRLAQAQPTAENRSGQTLAAPRITAPSTQTSADDPVLRNESARQLREEDRTFLESLNDNALPPAVGEQPPSLNPPEKKAAPRQNVRRPENPKPKKNTPARHDEQPALPSDQAEAFVRDYLAVCETNQISSELGFYSNKVKYFDEGLVDRRFIEKDIAGFYRRWPERSYQLLDFKVLPAGGDAAVVKFRIAYQYRNAKHAVSGKTDNTFTIERDGERLSFNALHEWRVTD